MKNNQEIRYCSYCDHVLKGRIDKKFCNDYCRNSYHFENSRINSKVIFEINRQLKKNRKILQTLLSQNQVKLDIEKEGLLIRGFNFMYYTHVREIDGSKFFFCYDYAYKKISQNTFEISEPIQMLATKA